MMRATVAQRPQSIVPQQYLFLMNSSFMVQRAQSLVGRLHGAAESNEQRIKTAYQLLYNRSPGPLELQIGMEFVEGDPANDDSVDSESDSQRLSSWTRYAQVLLSSNEFMFVR
jgi:hypothetical protein